MKLYNRNTGKEIPAQITLVEPSDYLIIKSSGRFDFDWHKERKFLVYKLTEQSGQQILGLISLIDFPREVRIHISLLEASKENRGKGKIIDCIPGCLISFTANKAFSQGYDGFVSLTPKTQLIDYYIEKHGFVSVGLNLALTEKAARVLIDKYLEL